MKPKLLDLFCCAGGASKGYHRAGFEVIGVDIKPQPRYPYKFIRADALTMSKDFLQEFDLIHASPPCQAYSLLMYRNKNKDDWPELIEPVREMLKNSGTHYVIENVERAPLIDPVILCGTMFPGLRVRRHRAFEASFFITTPKHGVHQRIHTFDKRAKHRYGKTNQWDDFVQVTGGNFDIWAGSDAMGINWMIKSELSEAIPPAYAEHIGLEFCDEPTNF